MLESAAGTIPGPGGRKARTSSSPKPQLTPKKLDTAKDSYALTPQLHEVGMPMPMQPKSVSNCQVCGTARGMKKPGERYQTSATMRCTECNVNVCGAGCWQLLHGCYKGGKLRVPARAGHREEHAGTTDEPSEVEGGSEEDEESGSGSEQ